MIPDTFFFVHVIVDENEHIYGPYIELKSAIEILVDMAPSIGAALSTRKKYTYQAMIKEKIIEKKEDQEIWKTISTPISEEKAYMKQSHWSMNG